MVASHMEEGGTIEVRRRVNGMRKVQDVLNPILAWLSHRRSMQANTVIANLVSIHPVV